MINATMKNLLDGSESDDDKHHDHHHEHRPNKMKKVLPNQNANQNVKQNSKQNTVTEIEKKHLSKKPSIDFSNFFDSNINTKIKTFVSRDNNCIHLWNSLPISNLIVKSTNNKITIDNLFKKNNFSGNDKIVISGNVDIFNLKLNIMYSGIICYIDNSIYIKFSKPVIPLFVEINSILQFNIFLHIENQNNIM